MAYPMGEAKLEPLRIDFDRRLKLEIHGSDISCDGRPLPYRKLDHALAYNLGNSLRTRALPDEVGHWSLTTLREKLAKIGAKVVRHGRYLTFLMAGVAIPRTLFIEILRLLDGLLPAPLPPRQRPIQ